MKKIKNIIIIIVALIILAGIIYGVNSSSNDKSEDIHSKIKSELEFLSSHTIKMADALNNLSDLEYKVETHIQNEVNNTQNAQSSEGDSGDNTQNLEQEEKKEASQTNTEGKSSSQKKNTISSTGVSDIKENAILSRDKNSINWSSLQVEAEQLYSYWLTTEVDLNSINVPNDILLRYNDNIDNLLISIKNKDKTNSLICLANLYSLIPQYMNYTNNSEKANIYQIKSDVICAYSIIENNDFASVGNYLADAEKIITANLNSANIKQNERNTLNKSYVLLKELIKSVNDRNIDLFYLKYVNLMEELDNI